MVAFSVILATRNERKYIGKTLRKILEASDEVGKHGVSTEIIVVDSSTDDTFIERARLRRPQSLQKTQILSSTSPG